VRDNLRVCFIRHKGGQADEIGKTIGMRAKYFIVDGACTSIGSHNLDLAEWGVVIDDETSTERMNHEG
jgi:phosphatidylserine/phosphatidylglycerophosphate/cardiolipin synthase-like enzyme